MDAMHMEAERKNDMRTFTIDYSFDGQRRPQGNAGAYTPLGGKKSCSARSESHSGVT